MSGVHMSVSALQNWRPAGHWLSTVHVFAHAPDASHTMPAWVASVVVHVVPPGVPQVVHAPLRPGQYGLAVVGQTAVAALALSPLHVLHVKVVELQLVAVSTVHAPVCAGVQT